MRILDFNTWSGLTYLGILKMGRYDGEDLFGKRRRAMIAQIKKLDPDIVCLHELNPLPQSAMEIAKELNMDCYWHIHLGGLRIGRVGIPWNLREGDAIFAKKNLKLKAKGRRRLSGGYVGRFLSAHIGDATQILGAEIQINNRNVPIFTTHWHAGIIPGPDIHAKAREIMEKENIPKKKIDAALKMMQENGGTRLKEAERTIDFVGNKETLILTGDFNSNPDTPELERMRGAGFIDAFQAMNPNSFGATWNYSENTLHQKFYSDYDPNLYLRLNYTRLKQPHRLDYIFYKSAAENPIRLKRCEVVMKETVDGVIASDHFGVLAEFEV